MRTTAFLIGLALVLSACVTGNVTAEETIKIGGLFGLTGFSSEWGETDYQGSLLAIEELNARGGINGRQIEFIVEDTKSDFVQTVVAMEKLVNVDDVDVVIGATWGEFSSVAVPIAIREDVVLISPSAGGESEAFHSPQFFNVWPTARFEIQRTLDAMVANGHTNVAVVYSLNQWSEEVLMVFKEEAVSRGVTVVTAFATDADEKDFRSIILRLRQQNIGALYVPVVSESVKGLLLRQMYELQYLPQVYSTESTQSNELLGNFVDYAEGILYAYPADTPGQEAFFAKYAARFGKEPSSPNALSAYDAVMALEIALKQKPQSTDELIQFLLGVDFPGISNHISFDSRGQIANKDYIIKTVRNGKFVTVS